MVVNKMKRFNISVNGKAYDVAVEEIAGGASSPVITPVAAPAAATPQAAPVAAAAPVAVANPAPVVSVPVEGGTQVTAPMPGTINDVKVAVGDSVSEAQVLVILEAMKMENDIVAPKAGTVAAISVRKGDSVNTNDLLITIQ